MAYKGRMFLNVALACTAMLMAVGASAQYFNFSVTVDLQTRAGVAGTPVVVNPGPPVTYTGTPTNWLDVGPGHRSYMNIYPGSNNTGVNSFPPGSAITLVDLVDFSNSPTADFLSVNTPATFHVTMTPTDAAGNPIPGGFAETRDLTGTFLATPNPPGTFISRDQGNILFAWDVQTVVFSWPGLTPPLTITTQAPPPGGQGFNTPGAPGALAVGSASVFVRGNLTQVPEPGVLGMLFGSGIGGSLLMFRRLRRR